MYPFLVDLQTNDYSVKYDYSKDTRLKDVAITETGSQIF
jgi:hypothetical protein